MLVEFITYFVISILRCAGELYGYPTHQRHRVYQERLISGKISFKEKEELLDKFYSFLESYTQNIGKKMEITRRDLTLSPIYAEKLYGIINMLITNSHYVISLPKLLDVINYYVVNQYEVEHHIVKLKLLQNDEDYDTCLKILYQINEFLLKKPPDFF